MQTHNSTTALAFLQSSSLPMLMQEEIERLIMTGELAVGARINESELAQRFNTSRGPIREALGSKLDPEYLTPFEQHVSLRLTPKYGAASVLSVAFVSGDLNTATWKVTVTPPPGFFTLQARATAP